MSSLEIFVHLRPPEVQRGDGARMTDGEIASYDDFELVTPPVAWPSGGSLLPSP